MAEWAWYGQGAAARLTRALLTPLGWAFGAVVGVRGALYDRGILHAAEPELPVLGVGNLTVGGTGKTPVAAELARRLRAAGARPAIVLRGYGGDEPLVHARLNPGVPVVAGADRSAGVREAASAGADLAVLDDVFQHRQLRRDLDIVLVSADRWGRTPVRHLPAGPWRETLTALNRASLAIVTRKAAGEEDVEDALSHVREAAPGVPVAVARLELGAMVGAAGDIEGEHRTLESIQGRRVVVAAAIGDPTALLRQLQDSGAELVPRVWPDHHAFTGNDAAALASFGGDADLVVCTLKDAVKLAPLWPRVGLPLWYVSQAVTFERGEDEVRRVLTALLDARSSSPRNSR